LGNIRKKDACNLTAKQVLLPFLSGHWEFPKYKAEEEIK
jgi:hypothetical protein